MKSKRAWSRVLVLAGVTLSWSAPWAWSAQDEAGPTPEQIATAKAATDDKEDKKDKDKPDFPPFDEVTKGFKKIPSADPSTESTFLTLWFKEKEDKLLVEVPKAMIGKDFLMATSIAGGSFYTGLQWSTNMVQWERMGKKLLLVVPDTRFEPSKGSTVAEVVRRSYTAQILSSVAIVTESPAGNPVVDFGELFKSDISQLGRVFGLQIKKDLCKWGKFKAFPKNVELPVETAISGMTPDGTATRILLHYSLSELPDTDYKPRAADERVGYFMTVTKDWGKKYDEDTLFNRHINRWHLQKVDSSLKLSPVKEPIIWYIEKTVPIRWRRYVKAGILEWNRAFEKCGFLDAVQVRQQTETEFANLDPEDVRYNFFRWIVTGRPFAAGPSRAHPRTGQILDADIIFDDSFVRVLTQQFDLWSPAAIVGTYDPLLEEFFDANPKWRPPSYRERLLPISFESTFERPSAKFDAQLAEHMFRRGQFSCDYAVGMARELNYAAAVFSSEGRDELSEKFLGELIKEVVMHEVGHCLGLRHNFKGSAWLEMDVVLSDEDSPTRATTGSVMDYNPAIFKHKGADTQPQFITRTVGPYDYWAIEYGYRNVEAPHTDEAEMLKSITDRVAESGLGYGTDEDCFFFSPDPHINRYDYGDDPVEYVQYRLEQAGRLLEDIPEWGVEDGESYSRLRRAFDVVLGTYGYVGRFAARFVGGVHVNRDYKGDPDGRPPFEVVDVEIQRAALKLVCDEIFSDKNYQFDPELINKLGAGRFWHWDSDQFNLFTDYPLHDRVRAIQWWSLFTMLNPFTLNRIYNAELQVDSDEEAMTITELFETLTDRIWSELEGPCKGSYSARKPFVSSFRRGLQRTYLQILIELAVNRSDEMGVPADVRSVVFLTLQELSDDIEDMLKSGGKKLDPFSRAHLTEAKIRVDKALDAGFLTS